MIEPDSESGVDESSDDKPGSLSTGEPVRLDPVLVAALFVKHSEELRRFVQGVLHNSEQAAEKANDVLQITFVKAIELGHTAREESLKGWLFRVAYNEAIVMRRRQAVQNRATDTLAALDPPRSTAPETFALRREAIEQVRAAIEQLPTEQATVVRLRMYDDKTFAEIATSLGIPLGTVLTRMQLALRKLKRALSE